MKQKILIAGTNGQLGQCLKKLEADYSSEYEFFFLDRTVLDITDKNIVEEAFHDIKPHFCINASAYTAVDLAEKEKEATFAVNANGVRNLAEVCNEYKTIFIHVSTDYVFDGETRLPYEEDDVTNPLGVYGASKLQGEEWALEYNHKSIIVRTSWLYSEFNKNFVKTMLHLFKTKEELNVVADQYGQPTNANDLAAAIMKIIQEPQKTFGIFHFSNYPETTWFDFASKIAELSGSSIKINPITTQEYPTPAKRPKRSTMCLDKILKTYHIQPNHWEHSLRNCIEILKTQK